MYPPVVQKPHEQTEKSLPTPEEEQEFYDRFGNMHWFLRLDAIMLTIGRASMCKCARFIARLCWALAATGRRNGVPRAAHCEPPVMAPIGSSLTSLDWRTARSTVRFFSRARRALPRPRCAVRLKRNEYRDA